MRRLAAKAGMPQADVQRLRGHSLRSGGATDYLSSGLLTEAWVQKQGGWLSQVFKIYYRPTEADQGPLAALIRRTAAGDAG
jgi:integrase